MSPAKRLPGKRCKYCDCVIPEGEETNTLCRERDGDLCEPQPRRKRVPFVPGRAPPNAMLEIEQEMLGFLLRLQVNGGEVDRVEGYAHDNMVHNMKVLRGELLALCRRYPRMLAKLKGGHRADGWKRPE